MTIKTYNNIIFVQDVLICGSGYLRGIIDRYATHVLCPVTIHRAWTPLIGPLRPLPQPRPHVSTIIQRLAGSPQGWPYSSPPDWGSPLSSRRHHSDTSQNLYGGASTSSMTCLYPSKMMYPGSSLTQDLISQTTHLQRSGPDMRARDCLDPASHSSVHPFP